MTISSVTAKGIWGTCAWHIEDTGQLVIEEGTGSSLTSIESVPWHRYKDQITSVCFSKNTVMKQNSALRYMFYGCERLKKIDFTGLDTAGVTSMGCMFQLCRCLEEIEFTASFSTQAAADMSLMFASCSSLKKLDLTLFKTPALKNMMGMFMNCSALKSIDLSGLDTAKATDMSMLFTGCSRLKRVDLFNFDTGAAEDMSSMFANCTELTHVDLSSFDTSKTQNMQNMFMYCSSLASLDLSAFHVTDKTDITDLLKGCDKLASITIGESFKPGTGFGLRDKQLQTEKEASFSGLSLQHDDSKSRHLQWLSSASGRAYHADEITFGIADIYFLAGSMFSLSYEEGDGTGSMDKAGGIYRQGEMPVAAVNDFTAPKDGIFKEWNTKRDGSGRTYQEGESLAKLCSDVVLYAIWAHPPFIHTFEKMDSIRYGQRLPIKIPDIEENNGRLTAAGIEISLDGSSGWEEISHNTILTVDYDGYYLRFYAENFVGRTYSNQVKINIGKGIYDMSGVYWENDGPLIYDGEPKSISLRGVPKGVYAYYANNSEINAGRYVAAASFGYDKDNYEMPGDMSCEWQIRKGRHDMSGIKWVADETLIYNGKVKRVFIANLPEGVMASYEQNEATDAGLYKAKAIFDVTDHNNYEIPQIVQHAWKIEKAAYDCEGIKWVYEDNFVYDGKAKKVYLEGLPEGAAAIYEGNYESNAGIHTASAKINYEHHNYEPPKIDDFKWQIHKAVYPLGRTRWTKNITFTYDGKAKSVLLRDLPQGLYASYYGNEETRSGTYIASAILHAVDSNNYEAPSIDPCYWQIDKAEYDMSSVSWIEEEATFYNKPVKQVRLTGLPDGITATYVDNKAGFAGSYISLARLEYDKANYQMPIVRDYHWQVREDEEGKKERAI